MNKYYKNIAAARKNADSYVVPMVVVRCDPSPADVPNVDEPPVEYVVIRPAYIQADAPIVYRNAAAQAA